jgi:murein DD-endopeptidase MepM/ murein hydrolase activator NlpD
MENQLLQPEMSRRDVLRFFGAAATAGAALSLDLLVSAQQELGVRIMENNREYTLRLHSRWYQQGDLIVAEIEPHVPMQDLTCNFSATKADGTTRRLSLPQLIQDGKTFVFFGTDFAYPAQNAKLDLSIISGGKEIKKSYQVAVKALEKVRTQNFSSKDTQNAEPRTPEDLKSIERENRLLIPSWGNHTAKLPYVAGQFQLPRPVCDFESFGARRVYDGELRSRHNGMDCSGNISDVISAALPGKVVLSDDGFFYMGNSIVLQHGFGLYTLYAHMNKRNVSKGDIVGSGQNIGLIGKSGRVTGPHLHWQAKLYGMNINPKSLEVLNYVFKK